MSPKEALEKAIWAGICSESKSTKLSKPGAIVERMGDEIREALKKLREEHVQDVRNDNIFINIKE